jgi:hypothetical protein
MSKPLYTLQSILLEDRTLGSIISPDGEVLSKTLELPWKDNQRSISCICEGIFPVTKEKPIPMDDPNTDEDESGGRIYRPYWHFRMHDVPNRSGILWHRGVLPKHSKGCILVGSRFGGYFTKTPTLLDSKAKLEWLVANLPDKFDLQVIRKKI